MADSLNVVAAILGAGLGLLIAFRLGVFRRGGEELDPNPGEVSRPSGYVSTQQPSAAPILGALGAGLLGVGLATASRLGLLSLALIIVGIALLVAAVITAVNRRSNTPSQ